MILSFSVIAVAPLGIATTSWQCPALFGYNRRTAPTSPASNESGWTSVGPFDADQTRRVFAPFSERLTHFSLGADHIHDIRRA